MTREAEHQTSGGEGGVGPISKLRNNKRRILGLEWSMSEVGTPPPHNSDKPHGLVDRINNNNNNHKAVAEIIVALVSFIHILYEL